MIDGSGAFPSVLLWGFVATVLMTTILLGSQGLGLSRLSLPFLFGTALTGNRRWAYVLGYLFYGLGGWVFAFLYASVFAGVGFAAWWLGALVGLLHGLFLLVLLAEVPYIHPRMASEFDQPSARRQLEPPGFLGLNYGRPTPLTTLLGFLVYGLVLGAFLRVR